MEYEFTYTPLGYKIVLYTLIVLGLVWAIIVYYVNFPVVFGTSFASSRMQPMNLSKAEKKHKNRNKNKSVKRPTKYALVPTNGSPTSPEGDSSAISTSTNTTPWWDKQKRTDTHTQRTPRTATQLTHQRQRAKDLIPSTTPTPTTHNQTPLSPINPFLPPLLHRRTSSEWLRERSAFFDSSPSDTEPDLPPRYSTASPALCEVSPAISLHGYDDVDSQPSTTASPTSQHSSMALSEVDNLDGTYGEGRSWADAVEGAVDWAVGGLARWADGGGDEALVVRLAAT